MTFTLSTKSRRVCAHPTSPFHPIPHTVLFFSIRVSCRISRGTLPRAAGPSAPRRSPHGAAPEAATCAWRRAAGPLPPPPLALQLMRPCRRRAWGAGGKRARGAPTPLSSSTPPILLLRILLGCCARRLDRRGRSRGGGGGGGALGAARTVGKRGRGRGAAAPRCSPRSRTKGTAVACCCRLAGRLSASGVLVPPGVARCHGARSLWQWPARCRSPTGPSQLPPTQRRLGCWLPSSSVRGRPPRRPERCRPRAR